MVLAGLAMWWVTGHNLLCWVDCTSLPSSNKALVVGVWGVAFFFFCVWSLIWMIPVFWEGEGYRWVKESFKKNTISAFWRCIRLLQLYSVHGVGDVSKFFILSYILKIREFLLRPCYSIFFLFVLFWKGFLLCCSGWSPNFELKWSSFLKPPE